MPNRKPHVVIFFGGDKPSHDLSMETGHWLCHYIPRDKYQVTPVHITPDGSWQVPLGSLPKQGPVKNMMERLFASVRPLPPVQGVQRLLTRPVDAMFSVLRGRGGDDGGTQVLGHALNIPVAGSPAATCQLTANKHRCAQAVDSITRTPLSFAFKRQAGVDTITDELRDDVMLPLFVKPTNQEGSHGIEHVQSMDELAAAIRRVREQSDLMVQEALPGTELNITLLESRPGTLLRLPPTLIVPKHAQYYDHLAKRRPGRVQLQTDEDAAGGLLAEAEAIARDVYDELDCRGFASFDLVANDDGLTLLEVNTVPTITAATPLLSQLQAAGIDPGRFIESLIQSRLHADENSY